MSSETNCHVHLEAPNRYFTFESYEPKTDSQNEALSTLQNLARRALLRVLTKARFGANEEGALVVLTGSPGVGKTHLAHGFVHKLNSGFQIERTQGGIRTSQDGVFFVPSLNQIVYPDDTTKGDLKVELTCNGGAVHPFFIPYNPPPSEGLLFPYVKQIPANAVSSITSYVVDRDKKRYLGKHLLEPIGIEAPSPTTSLTKPFKLDSFNSEEGPFQEGILLPQGETYSLTRELFLSTSGVFGLVGYQGLNILARRILVPEDATPLQTPSSDPSRRVENLPAHRVLTTLGDFRTNILLLDDVGRTSGNEPPENYWKGIRELIGCIEREGKMCVITTNFNVAQLISNIAGPNPIDQGRIASRFESLTLGGQLVSNILGPDHRKTHSATQIDDAI